MGRKLWNRDYILLLQGSAVSAFGDVLYSVAVGYWVYAKAGSSTLMGIMSSISMVVTMVLPCALDKGFSVETAASLLCDVFPIPAVFAGGMLLSSLPMVYLCFHPNTREFITTH